MSTNRKSTFIPLALLIAALFAFARPAHAQTTDQYPIDAWQAQYWNNRDFDGSPIYVSTTPAINYYWGDASPVPGVIFSDNWAARWTRTIYSNGGTYRVIARMDDGMRIYLDGRLIIDSWYDSQEHTVTTDVAVAAGYHTVRVDYYDAAGVAVAVVDYETINAGGGTFYPNWKAEYFNNTSLSGAPVLVQDVAVLNLDWDNGSPAPGIVGNDFFSARYTRVWQGAPGQYRLTLTSDDGSRLYVNNQLLIDNWAVQDSTGKSIDYTYNGTPVNLMVEYFEYTGGAKIVLDTQLISGSGGGGGIVCPAPSGNTATVISGGPLNVRSGPGTQFPVVGQLQPCEQVTILGSNANAPGWVYIEDFNRNAGWVSAEFLSISSSAGIQ